MNPTPDKKSRFLGCLMGLAVGDALGTTLEFRARGTFTPLEDMVGGGPFDLNPGEWTDDTSMALCLGASLLEKGGFDPKDQMVRYTRWRREGYMSSVGRCFDIGNTVAGALEDFRVSGKPFSGSTDQYSAGNGSIMRLAPVPMYYGNDAAKAIEFSMQSSRTTHGAATCVDACRYLGGLIWGALNGLLKEDLMEEWYSPVKGGPLLEKKIDKIAAGSFKHKTADQIRGSGYVVESLEAALWAFWNSTDYRTGALQAVNLGDDADTTGAIYGQLAGAFYGLERIPLSWREKIKDGKMILEMAERLFAASQ